MTDICACGCGRETAGSYWNSDECLKVWLAKQNNQIEPVRVYCGSTYTEKSE